MELGVAFSSDATSWKTVRRAEELGLAEAWFYDTQLLCADPFVVMAAAAVHTERIRLGTGVLIPSNRIAPVTANAIASLNRLAPGRIDLGVGTGFTARRTMGLGGIKLSEMEDHLRVVRALWAGETVDCRFDGETRKIRFLNPETGAIDVDSPIGIHVSAFAPKGRRLTARIADGWITFGTGDDGLRQQIDDVVASCREEGRDPASLRKTVFGLGAILDDGEPADSPRARRQAGPLVATIFHSFVEARKFQSVVEAPPELAPLIEAYEKAFDEVADPDAPYASLHRGHLMFTKREEEMLMLPDLIRAVTFTGTRAELRERFGNLRDMGVDQFAIQVVPGEESALDDWAELFRSL